MALKNKTDIQPIEHTGKKPKKKKPKKKRGTADDDTDPALKAREPSPNRRKRQQNLCADCGDRLRGGHVVERSGKKKVPPKIYCLSCG